MSASLVFASVVLANLFSVWFGYLLWRVSRDETDNRAILGIIVCCAIAALIGISILR